MGWTLRIGLGRRLPPGPAMIREPWALRAALRWLGGSLALQDCLLCHGHSRGAPLCGFCRRALPACARGLDRDALARACGLEALRLRFDYRAPLDGLIQRYKYRGELALAPALAALLPLPPPLPADGGRWLLAAVPTDPCHVRERGFDHLELLARRYARRHRLERLHIERRPGGPGQAGLGRRRRRANLRSAFRPGALAPGCAVLILDDVLTTGATLAALGVALRQAGAETVGAVVLARTPRPSELRPAE